MMRQRRKSWCGCCVSNTRGHDHPVMSALPPARKRARLWALTGIGAPTRENDAVRNRFRHLGRRRGARRPLMRAGHTGFQRLKESVKGVPNSDEQTVAEKMRSLLRFGAGSMRHRDVFDVYHRLRIKGIDVGVLGSCTAKDIFGDESMREEDWADASARLERVFEDRRCVRQLSGAKDNWLELPVGKVTVGILPEVKKLMMKC